MTTPPPMKGSIAIAGGAGVIAGTPRFSNEEKEILYGLFHDHEAVIDIKIRKTSKNKISLRDAWAKIVEEYNSHPHISTRRNAKQIQKFWLNSRLRKQYPFTTFSGNSNRSQSSEDMTLETQTEIVKCEPEVEILSSKPDETSIMDTESEFEEVIIPANSPQSVETLEVSQHGSFSQIATQQISVDQISAEKLTLNDLLQFKNTRPREEIILQIKNPDGQNILGHTQKITLPTHHFKHHQIITESPQQLHHHTTQIPTSPSICTYTSHIHNPHPQVAQQSYELYDDKMNFFRLKEAELKCKEEQLALEQKKMELTRAQEEMKHMKELHRLQIEEMKIKIRILQEEEKKLNI